MRNVFKIALVAVLSVPAAAAVKTGEKAPDFTLTDTQGKARKLSEFKGKTVVLEWVNHDCPYVKKHYESGNMQKTQKDYTSKGVVWLSVNSSAKGKQGHVTPAEADKLTKDKGAAPTALLIDEKGEVGRLYAAKTTPHMYVVDAKGTLVYEGAIDNKPTTDKADVATAKNLVATALDETLAGKAVTTANSKPYGCSVKY
jgi:peroxiredoxin